MINIDINSFENSIKDGKNLVFFWGPNCTKCHALMPQVEDYINDYGNINFYDVNIKDSRNLAKREGVRTLPTIIFYENGEKSKTLNGLNANLDDILDYLDLIN